MRISLLFIFISLLLLGACRRDPLFQGKAELTFSSDTVFFDTVFTTIGSITERIKIFNPYDRTIEISSIYLENGSASNFKLNADGTSGRVVNDLTIAPFDSMFVFIEVTVDPNGGTNPMVLEEKLIVQTEQNAQSVQLVAWGQDAYFYPSISFGDQNGDGLGDSWVLPIDKPIVFYGYSIVDTGAVLTIPCGARVHFHSNSGLIVGHEASLKILGCVGDPIIIQGDRLESFFDDVPGQWGELYGGIYLTQTSVDNEVRNAIIKNGTVGITVDSNTNENPTLILENTQILNMSFFGLLAQDSRIEAVNSVIANCGDHAVALRYGGNYSFNHCTFANFWSENPRSKATLLLNNYFEVDGQTYVRDLTARFDNTIIYGALDEELALDENETEVFDYFFDHCVIKSDTNELNDPIHFNSIVLNPRSTNVDGEVFDALFENVSKGYQLNQYSAAINNGFPTDQSTDIVGNGRVGVPDIGAYEYVD
ncbi:MAG: right-handed parallel beta-helix repeat-containing protein [Salibacteraceae bacterium]